MWLLCQIRLGPGQSVACSLRQRKLSCESEYRQAQAKCWQLLGGDSAHPPAHCQAREVHCVVLFLSHQRSISYDGTVHTRLFSGTGTGSSFPWALSLAEQKPEKDCPSPSLSLVSSGKHMFPWTILRCFLHKLSWCQWEAGNHLYTSLWIKVSLGAPCWEYFCHKARVIPRQQLHEAAVT